MADFKKAKAAFLEMVEDLDPDVKVNFPAKVTQGNYLIELSRGGDEKGVVIFGLAAARPRSPR